MNPIGICPKKWAHIVDALPPMTCAQEDALWQDYIRGIRTHANCRCVLEMPEGMDRKGDRANDK